MQQLEFSSGDSSDPTKPQHQVTRTRVNASKLLELKGVTVAPQRSFRHGGQSQLGTIRAATTVTLS